MGNIQGIVEQVQNFPWREHCLPCACIVAGGDAINQLVSERRRFEDVDWKRLGRYTLIGFFVVGPVFYKWYEFLEGELGHDDFEAIATKVILDQIILVPSMTFIVLSSLQILSGNGFDGVKSTLDHHFKDVVISTYKAFPIIQALNFWLVPIQQQVLVDQVATVFWNAMLSRDIIF